MNMKQYLLSLEKCYPNFDGKLTKRYKQKKRLKNEIIAYNIINKSMNRVPGYQNDNNNKKKRQKMRLTQHPFLQFKVSYK